MEKHQVLIGQAEIMLVQVRGQNYAPVPVCVGLHASVRDFGQ